MSLEISPTNDNHNRWSFLNNMMGISVVGLFGGIYTASWLRKNPSRLSGNGGFSLAMKALGIGTLLSASMTGIGVFCVARYLDVSSIQEFTLLIKQHSQKWEAEMKKNQEGHQ